MNNKLFHVLVAGGCAFLAACVDNEEAPREPSQSSAVDANNGADAIPSDGGPLASNICGESDEALPKLLCSPDDPEACTSGVVTAGFCCCWATQC